MGATASSLTLSARAAVDETERAAAAARLGLDQPIWMQFLLFLKDMAMGDLGRSFVHGSSAVLLILERMPATLELALVALFLATALGIPLGILAGLKSNSWIGRTIMTGSIVGFSLPTFFTGLDSVADQPWTLWLFVAALFLLYAVMVRKKTRFGNALLMFF